VLDPGPDPSQDPDPSLPAPLGPGGVFTGVQPAVYWSASTVTNNPANAWVVDFFEDHLGHVDYTSKAKQFHVWCVRGDMKADAY
jgi:hypothetical protein